MQTVAWWTRPIGFLERCRARYGRRFTIRLLGQVPLIMLSDPHEVRELFTAPADVLHPGEGARILEPVVGRNSVILLDEDAHLEQRKLLLPAFHGEKMKRLERLVFEVAEREVGRWPRGQVVALHPRMQALTLEVILRAVFGLESGARLDALRERLTAILELGARPAGMLPFLQRDLGRLTPWARFERLRAEADALIYDLIDERRARDEERDDVLALLLEARHEDGEPMSSHELRDELMTLLVAGHETTASELAWAFERLARSPSALDRLTHEVDAGEDDAYLTATIQETLRRRPVLPNAAPRLVKQPVEIGGFSYPVGVCVVANAYLIHHDPHIYRDPYAFRPERFLDEAPGTYTWIPFGGGRRRCLGASFATLEMKAVLRAVLARTEIRADADGRERARRRSITLSPRRAAATVLEERPARAGEQPVAA
ncbi:MAG TPA: cytochrome P450 [Thermoleophilaceae bacterium]|nr:cytochrome P450 [Thermoleophilaceae bacterium]